MEQLSSKIFQFPGFPGHLWSGAMAWSGYKQGKVNCYWARESWASWLSLHTSMEGHGTHLFEKKFGIIVLQEIRQVLKDAILQCPVAPFQNVDLHHTGAALASLRWPILRASSLHCPNVRDSGIRQKPPCLPHHVYNNSLPLRSNTFSDQFFSFFNLEI